MIVFIPAPEPSPEQVEAETWPIGMFQPTDSVWPRAWVNQTKAGIVLALQFGPESDRVHAALTELDALEFLDSWLGEHGQRVRDDIAELFGARPDPKPAEKVDQGNDPIGAFIRTVIADPTCSRETQVQAHRLRVILERQTGRA